MGLRGDEIHPLAAVIALTDIFDGKTTHWGDEEKQRPYPVLKSILDEAGMVEQQTLISFIKLLGRVPETKAIA